MAKTNFTKAEEALSEALQKIEREKLMDLTADSCKVPVLPTPEIANRISLVHALDREIKQVYRSDQEIYIKLGLKKKTMEKWTKEPQNISVKDMEKIKNIKDQVDVLMKQHPVKAGSDEQIVEKERLKHVNKRFNVNDKWLPLR